MFALCIIIDNKPLEIVFRCSYLVKIIFKKENPLYIFFKSIGVVVFNANEIKDLDFDSFKRINT